MIFHPPINFRATYCNWAGDVVTVTVQARQTVGYNSEPVWYAIADPLGCGKNADTARDAVGRLVRDHGTQILSVEEVIE